MKIWKTLQVFEIERWRKLVGFEIWHLYSSTFLFGILANLSTLFQRYPESREGEKGEFIMQIINTTPHSIRFQRASDGEVFEVAPCGVLINAKVTEVTVGTHPSGAELVKVVFTGDEANTAALDNLERENPGAVIIGSMVAAQGFPGRVFAMIPATGFERVPVDQKRMRDDKFTSF